jgi:hypothetical protein
MEANAFFEYMNKWHGNLNNKLWTRHCLDFIVEIIKAIVKKKGTLAFYTLRYNTFFV